LIQRSAGIGGSDGTSLRSGSSPGTRPSGPPAESTPMRPRPSRALRSS
jgi:hypothetical protein